MTTRLQQYIDGLLRDRFGGQGGPRFASEYGMELQGILIGKQ